MRSSPELRIAGATRIVHQGPAGTLGRGPGSFRRAAPSVANRSPGRQAANRKRLHQRRLAYDGGRNSARGGGARRKWSLEDAFAMITGRRFWKNPRAFPNLPHARPRSDFLSLGNACVFDVTRHTRVRKRARPISLPVASFGGARAFAPPTAAGKERSLFANVRELPSRSFRARQSSHSLRFSMEEKGPPSMVIRARPSPTKRENQRYLVSTRRCVTRYRRRLSFERTKKS